ncbi:TPA: hypothetical protein ACGO2G_000039 [Streptococcus suis]
MNKQDWVDYFRALNGRDPSPQEFFAAKNNGEFVEVVESVIEESSVNTTFKKATTSVKNVKIPDSMANIFASIDKTWFFRQYVIAAIFTAFLFYTGSQEIGTTIFFIICFILTPWSRFVWVSITNFFFGGTGLLIFLPFYIMLIVQFALYSITFLLSPIIAPIGFLYLHLRINVFKK